MNVKRFLLLLINAFILFVIFFMLTRSLWTLLIFVPAFASLFIKKGVRNG
ncbi:MAG: hypothetical protein BWX57_00524 [Tenericutes bacterium ADurb.Bin024]|nr:MAG: hypothetical protein BWX57_00524 [Tenericutes bacterium ADurb.Bin024]